jgi:hypothetical protein
MLDNWCQHAYNTHVCYQRQNIPQWVAKVEWNARRYRFRNLIGDNGHGWSYIPNQKAWSEPWEQMFAEEEIRYLVN